MKNAWLIRPKPHGANRRAEFKEKNIISVGWSGIGSLEGKSREDLMQLLSLPPYSLEGQKLGVAYSTLDLFVNKMQVGDLVLMPYKDEMTFGEIAGGYSYDPDAEQDGYPHQRAVKWLRTAYRDDLSDDLRLSLRAPTIAANLSSHLAEIEAFCNGEPPKPSAPPAQDVLEVSYPLRPDFLLSFQIPKDLSREEAQRLSTYFSTLYFTE